MNKYIIKIVIGLWLLWCGIISKIGGFIYTAIEKIDMEKYTGYISEFSVFMLLSTILIAVGIVMIIDGYIQYKRNNK